MEKLLLLILILPSLPDCFGVSFVNSILAQKSAKITMDISSDTIGLTGNLEVTIGLENAPVKRFTPPTFEGFDVQGPSTSTSMSIINGDMTQSSTYTFYLTPQRTGSFKIGSTSIDTEGGILKTDEKEIIVVEKYTAEIKPRKRRPQDFWGDSEDPFFRQRPPATPQQQPVPEKLKKKYQTEKL